MGRPLTGSLRHYQGLWWAAIPKAKGSKARRQESFLTEDDARAWLAQAVAALRGGLPVPDPDRFRTCKRRPKSEPPPGPPETAKLQPDVASVSRAWMAAAYEDLRRGGPDREERVRRIVDGYLVPVAPRTATVADVTYFMCHDWLLHLVGREPAPKPVLGQTASNDGARPAGPEEYSLMGAAEACGVSEATVRRRWRAGLLPGAYRDPRGHVRVPAAALASIATRPRQPTGLSHKYVVDALWVLRKILGFARANGLFPPGFDPTESLAAPSPDPGRARARPPTSQPRPLSLPECARIAGHLHVPHQLVLWLQRIMGLRISEAFGIWVYDVIDLGEVGLIAIQGQGGRTFTIRDDHGRVVAVPHKETTKTAAGSRVLVAPAALMQVVRICIEAFHTDPDTGEIDRDARLVPGIYDADRSGQHGYRHALDEATTAEGLASADLGFQVSTHLLRKSLASDLAWQTGIEEPVKRRFMGHRAGEDVFGRIYTLDHPDVAPLVKVAAALDDNIAATIGTLIVPTLRSAHWGGGNRLLARADHIDATLADAGWMAGPGDPTDPLCDSDRVASELGIFVKTARRWMADGTLPVILAPDAQGVPRRYCRLSAVWAHRDHLAQRVMLPDLAEQLGLRYHELYELVRRLGIELRRHPTSRNYEVTPAAAAAIRAERERVQALHRRSMRLPAAARQLNLSVSTIRLLADAGQIDVDDETDSSGARFVTRGSVERHWVSHTTTKKRRAGQAPAAVPVAEVARFTGHTTSQLMDLVRAGVLQQVPGRRAAQLTATSLRAWMASRQLEATLGSAPAADGTIVSLPASSQPTIRDQR